MAFFSIASLIALLTLKYSLDPVSYSQPNSHRWELPFTFPAPSLLWSSLLASRTFQREQFSVNRSSFLSPTPLSCQFLRRASI